MVMRLLLTLLLVMSSRMPWILFLASWNLLCQLMKWTKFIDPTMPIIWTWIWTSRTLRSSLLMIWIKIKRVWTWSDNRKQCNYRFVILWMVLTKAAITIQKWVIFNKTQILISCTSKTTQTHLSINKVSPVKVPSLMTQIWLNPTISKNPSQIKWNQYWIIDQTKIPWFLIHNNNLTFQCKNQYSLIKKKCKKISLIKVTSLLSNINLKMTSLQRDKEVGQENTSNL